MPARLVLSLLMAIPAHAATTLTWEACVNEAASNNYDVEAAREQVARARSEHRASYAGFLPQLAAEAGYRRSSSTNDVTDTDRTANEYSYGLTARQSLFAGWRDRAGIDRAAAGLEGAEARLAIAKAKLSFDLKSAFAGVLFAEEQLTLAKEIASRRKANVRLVELRFEGGRENKGSYLRIKAYYRQAQYEVSQAERNVRVAERQLARVLSRNESDQLKVSSKWEVPRAGDRPDFRELAVTTPQYRLAAADQRAAEKGVTIAQSQLLPDLALTGSIGKQGAEFPPTGDRWAFGITLSLPLFPGGKNYFDLETARAEGRRAELSMHSTRDQVVLKLEETFAAFHDASERTEVQEEFFKAAELRAEVSRSKYTSGLISFEDWDLIENDLINTQKARLASLRDAWIAEAAWEQARGTGVIP